MGPKKEIKKEVQKRDKGADSEKKYTVEDSLNSDSWRCAVVIAVERTQYDCFVLQEFKEECHNGRRKEVSIIDFETCVMKILNDFANGELPYKYTFLLNFSSVFQEAVEYIEKKTEVPVHLLVKVVKALLIYLREENLMLIKSMAGSPDPIQAMAEKPTNFGSFSVKKKDSTKKGDNSLKVRPPSVTKEDTKLLRRGERTKDDRYIDDAPRNAYFNLYVLLTGFYNPDLPLELLKANIPLHGIMCIDTSLSGAKRDSEQKSPSERRPEEIQNFWDVFLKKIWDPKASFYFKDTVFQVYTPQGLLCDKKKLGEFIYREISYLMYDLSDLKRQLNNYLEHIHMWDVAEKGSGIHTAHIWPENLPEECASVPIMLQCIIDAICENNWKYHLSVPSDSVDSVETEWDALRKYYISNKYATYRSCAEGLGWSQELEERGDINLLKIYYKIKELDVKYDLDNQSVPSDNSEKAFGETDSSQATDHSQSHLCTEHVEENLLSSDQGFTSYWKKYNKDVQMTYAVDYSLYALLMTKVLCPYEKNVETSHTGSRGSVKKNSNFELIKNLREEMRKPHFTVTEGSRNILRAAPYNMKNTSRDFFCPQHFKVVSPEKVKASSAPVFQVTPGIKIQTLYTSEIFPMEGCKNPFKNLRGFLNECLFSNTNDFHFLEFLSKPKFLEKEKDHWSRYNCADHIYSILNDCIFLRLHNRKDGQNVHHETFNQTLRTVVGLRDFYEYVLEDEEKWLAWQEELYQANAFLSNVLIVRDSFRDFADSDFWMPNSLKLQSMSKPFGYTIKGEEVKTEPSSVEKVPRGQVAVEDITDDFSAFEGYNISNMAVQYSGLKTTYYTDDCSVTVQLIEKLYGNQDLGVHVTQASHSLHLYSYVCPEPHILDPFTFHVTCKNGIIVAFCRRFVETCEEVEQKIESTTTIKSKKNSSEVPTKVVKKEVRKSVKDEDFIYDMALSLPNGLSIRTVRRTVKPCYVKQSYLVSSEEIATRESSRLFLPNGNVIKIMKDDTVQILKMDASIITANLSDLISGREGEHLTFSRYEVISGEGLVNNVEDGKITSSKRFHVFQNMDMGTNQVFFRRKDGTDYMLQNDGTFCIQFKDGTKMSSSLLVQEPPLINQFSSPEEETAFQETHPDADFVFVFVEIIVEHPDYATVVHDNQAQKWKVLLPYNSMITVERNGHYFVDLDKQTELKVEADLLQMKNFSCERESQSTFTANLSIFDKEGGVYCHMADSSGKIFIVEANSNCYILNDAGHPETKHVNEQFPVQVTPKESELSEFIASADLQICPSISAHKSNKLLRENKYFVLRRDITGMELLHKDEVNKALTKTQKGTLIFTQNIQGTENRCFVLVTPRENKNIKKWGVGSILPNPKFEPGKSKKSSSTTYGTPPSWMHPFPKRKFNFVVPQPLTCRVFLETKKTELSPATGTLECYYCEMNDETEIKPSQIPQEDVEEYLKRLSNDDQDLLTEIYSLAAATLINEKKKLKPINSEKLKHYLELSRYYVAMREYHERCIRYSIVPNYFHHPAGMSWLILNKLLLKLRLSDEKTHRQILLQRTAETDTSESIGSLSNEEIEYNLSLKEEQSFSSVSYRSNLSAQTAPTILRTGGFCRCKVNAAKDTASCPAVKCFQKSDTSFESNVEEPHTGICEFQENNIEMFGKKECLIEKPLMSLEDLMYLGLI